MNIEEVISNMLNGEPVHDAVVIGIVFACFITFYNVFFSSMFTLFKK